MKKIISLLSAIALLATMLTTVAFADENNKIYWEEVSKTETTAVLKLVLETNMGLNSVSIKYDLTAAKEAGIEVSAEQLDATVFNATTEGQVDITATITDTTGKTTGKIELGTVTFDFTKATTKSLVLPSKKLAIKSGKTAVQTSFTDSGAGYTVAPETKPAAEKVEEGATFDDVDNEVIKAFAGEKTLTFAASANGGEEDAVAADQYVEIENTNTHEVRKSLQSIGQLLGGEGSGSISGKIFIYVLSANPEDTFAVKYINKWFK